VDWIFDMDGTLYSPLNEVWRETVSALARYFIERGYPVDWSEEEQRRLKQKWNTKQTLVAYHREFDFDFDAVVATTHLPVLDRVPLFLRPGVHRIQYLPGRKWILTNSPEDFAHAVLKKLGLNHVFNGIFGVRRDCFVCKPEPGSYLRVPVDADVFFIDDYHKNLEIPFDIGWKTIWFPETHVERPSLIPHYIHHEIHSMDQLHDLVS
jgi:putative hydrolase of the HAD superfamily